MDAFSEEWHNEWKHEWSGDIPKSPEWKDGTTIKNGDSIPGWKVTNTHANGHFSEEYLPWEDKQSDGKKSETKSWYTFMLQTKNHLAQELKQIREDPAAPAPAGAAVETAGGLGYDMDAFSEEWHNEWKHEWSGDIPKSPEWKDGTTIKNGDSVPGWKVTNTHANGHFSEEYLPWEDKQSDGKKSEAKSWYTLAQKTTADFKNFRGRAQRLAEDPAAPAPAGAAVETAGGLGYDHDAFNAEWNKEWKHEWSGDIPKSPVWKKGETIKNGHTVPGWKVTNTHANGHFSEEYLPWEDAQSDMKPSESKSWYT